MNFQDIEYLPKNLPKEYDQNVLYEYINRLYADYMSVNLNEERVYDIMESVCESGAEKEVQVINIIVLNHVVNLKEVFKDKNMVVNIILEHYNLPINIETYSALELILIIRRIKTKKEYKQIYKIYLKEYMYEYKLSKLESINNEFERKKQALLS